MHLLLLPGMDGTGLLFQPLVVAVEAEFRSPMKLGVTSYANYDALKLGVTSYDARHPAKLGVTSYDARHPASYDELFERLPAPTGPTVVIAESFSGPLGIRYADRYGSHVRGLVLVGSFASSPSAWAEYVARLGRFAFLLTPPRFALRLALLGPCADEALLQHVEEVLRGVHPAVLATRLSEIAKVDVSTTFAELTLPVLYLSGRFDRLVGAQVLQALLALRPDMLVEEIDAPHLIVQCKPEDCAKRIVRFIESVRPHP